MYSEELLGDLNLLAARKYQIEDELERQMTSNQEIQAEALEQMNYLRGVIGEIKVYYPPSLIDGGQTLLIPQLQVDEIPGCDKIVIDQGIQTLPQFNRIEPKYSRVDVGEKYQEYKELKQELLKLQNQEKEFELQISDKKLEEAKGQLQMLNLMISDIQEKSHGLGEEQVDDHILVEQIQRKKILKKKNMSLKQEQKSLELRLKTLMEIQAFQLT